MSDFGEHDRLVLVPDFWEKQEPLLIAQLAMLNIDEDDADEIAGDVIRRLCGIPAILPRTISERFRTEFTTIILKMIIAEQRLIAARTGLMPGRYVGDELPLTPFTFDDPLLSAMQGALNTMDAEVHRAEGGRRLN